MVIHFTLIELLSESSLTFCGARAKINFIQILLAILS